jgi:hypothetical protein
LALNGKELGGKAIAPTDRHKRDSQFPLLIGHLFNLANEASLFLKVRIILGFSVIFRAILTQYSTFWLE